MSKRRLTQSALVVMLLAICAAAHAGFRERPDANTLWLEDGVAIQVGDAQAAQRWRGGGLRLKPAVPGPGLRLSPADAEHGSSGRYVPVDPAYHWLVWEVAAVSPNPTGYVAFTGPFLAVPDRPPTIGQVAQIHEGIFAVDLLAGGHALKPGRPFLRFDLHGAALTLRYLKLVRQPANCIDVTSSAFADGALTKGAPVTFRVRLAQPAEDVSLRFFHSYCMPQLELNGALALQLKPEDGPGRVWSATVNVESISRGRLKRGSQYEPGALLIKAVVLGGGVKVPVWGTNPVPFNVIEWESER